VQGGLRLNYYFGREDERLPKLRAGDSVEALCRAQVSRNYQDPGAFDECGFLKWQDIELLGTLRSTELIEKTGLDNLTIPRGFARARALCFRGLTVSALENRAGLQCCGRCCGATAIS